MEPLIDEGQFASFVSFGAEGIFYIITLVFLFFSLSFAYHWFAYGTKRTYSVTALAFYLGVCALLFISMGVSLNTLS